MGHSDPFDGLNFIRFRYFFTHKQAHTELVNGLNLGRRFAFMEKSIPKRKKQSVKIDILFLKMKVREVTVTPLKKQLKR